MVICAICKCAIKRTVTQTKAADEDDTVFNTCNCPMALKQCSKLLHDGNIIHSNRRDGTGIVNYDGEPLQRNTHLYYRMASAITSMMHSGEYESTLTYDVVITTKTIHPELMPILTDEVYPEVRAMYSSSAVCTYGSHMAGKRVHVSCTSRDGSDWVVSTVGPDSTLWNGTTIRCEHVNKRGVLAHCPVMTSDSIRTIRTVRLLDKCSDVYYTVSYRIRPVYSDVDIVFRMSFDNDDADNVSTAVSAYERMITSNMNPRSVNSPLVVLDTVRYRPATLYNPRSMKPTLPISVDVRNVGYPCVIVPSMREWNHLMVIDNTSAFILNAGQQWCRLVSMLLRTDDDTDYMLMLWITWRGDIPHMIWPHYTTDSDTSYIKFIDRLRDVLLRGMLVTYDIPTMTTMDIMMSSSSKSNMVIVVDQPSATGLRVHTGYAPRNTAADPYVLHAMKLLPDLYGNFLSDYRYAIHLLTSKHMRSVVMSNIIYSGMYTYSTTVTADVIAKLNNNIRSHHYNIIVIHRLRLLDNRLLTNFLAEYMVRNGNMLFGVMDANILPRFVGRKYHTYFMGQIGSLVTSCPLTLVLSSQLVMFNGKPPYRDITSNQL